MLRSGTVQLAVKVAHEYLNKQSLLVGVRTGWPALPACTATTTLLTGGEGTLRAARAAQASRRAISELLDHGETEVSSWDIFDSFPSTCSTSANWSPSPNGTRVRCETCAPTCSGGGRPARCGS